MAGIKIDPNVCRVRNDLVLMIPEGDEARAQIAADMRECLGSVTVEQLMRGVMMTWGITAISMTGREIAGVLRFIEHGDYEPLLGFMDSYIEEKSDLLLARIGGPIQ